MSLHIGIVGLPNVGKSTLFNALTKSKGAMVANYPFCTIEPNVGVVEVPDDRLQNLATIEKPEKIIPAIIEFVDIAGLVKGASEGEGLGNKFLANIRQCDAIVQVVRVFQDAGIQHVAGDINPESDIQTIQTELSLADLETIQKRLSEVEKKSRAGDKESLVKKELIVRIQSGLNEGRMVSDQNLSDEEKLLIRDLCLLTAKPMLYAVNMAEGEVASSKPEALATLLNLPTSAKLIPVSAKVEQEISELGAEESKLFLQDLGLKESTLNALIRASYDLLGLATYFTAGPKEVRAWTFKKGAKAPEAAGVIHSDFEKGFIRAEVCSCQDFIALCGESACRQSGKLRSEGKEYVVKDGDVMHFLFS